MTIQGSITDLQAAEVLDSTGDKLGKVGQVYLTKESQEPSWVTVNIGLLGSKETFIPLADASYADGAITVPYEKSFIKDAPNVDEDGEISHEEEDELYRYYGVKDPARGEDRGQNGPQDGQGRGSGDAQGRADDAGQAGRSGQDAGTQDAGVGAAGPGVRAAGAGVGAAGAGAGTTGAEDRAAADGAPGDPARAGDAGAGQEAAPVAGAGAGTGTGNGNGDPAEGAPAGADERTSREAADQGQVQGQESVTLHEERLNVGTEKVETGRVRLRKHVVTETEQVEVPVQREEVVVERVPAGEETGGELSEGDSEAEVTLTEERPVVNKETVATEQVNIGTRTVQDTETVSGEVGHEEVDITDADGRPVEGGDESGRA
jgi:uncharacterized protein (TIGR02271 family)